MNETQIAQKLAANIPREEHIPAPVVEQAPQPSALDSNIALESPTTGTQIADYFSLDRVDRFSEQTQRSLRIVYEWASEIAGSTDLDKVLPVLRAYELELGITYAPDRLARMAKIIHLQKQAKTAFAQMEALRGNTVY